MGGLGMEGFSRRRKRWNSYEADNDKNTLYTYMKLSEIFRNKTINVTNNIRKYLKTTIWENCGHIFQSATKASQTLTFVPPCFSGFYMDVSTSPFC